MFSSVSLSLNKKTNEGREVWWHSVFSITKLPLNLYEKKYIPNYPILLNPRQQNILKDKILKLDNIKKLN